jgi:hypothetical protein
MLRHYNDVRNPVIWTEPQGQAILYCELFAQVPRHLLSIRATRSIFMSQLPA